jgi:hypothetical protein
MNYRQCGAVFKSTDDITSSLTNTPDGLRIVRQFWHCTCWDKRASEAFHRWTQGKLGAVTVGLRR